MNEREINTKIHTHCHMSTVFEIVDLSVVYFKSHISSQEITTLSCISWLTFQTAKQTEIKKKKTQIIGLLQFACYSISFSTHNSKISKCQMFMLLCYRVLFFVQFFISRSNFRCFFLQI